MKKEKRCYYFEGDILYFDQVVARNYKAVTYAVSEKQALSNIAAQFKRTYGYDYSTKISASGDICVR